MEFTKGTHGQLYCPGKSRVDEGFLVRRHFSVYNLYERKDRSWQYVESFSKTYSATEFARQRRRDVEIGRSIVLDDSLTSDVPLAGQFVDVVGGCDGSV